MHQPTRLSGARLCSPQLYRSSIELKLIPAVLCSAVQFLGVSRYTATCAMHGHKLWQLFVDLYITLIYSVLMYFVFWLHLIISLAIVYPMLLHKLL